MDKCQTVLSSIKKRCTYKNHPQYKDWGGRGIKCKILIHEIRMLWKRDKAYNMKCPSIDRIDNDGNYTYENCRFIEKAENSRRSMQKVYEFDQIRHRRGEDEVG